MTTLLHGFLGSTEDWQEFQKHYHYDTQTVRLPSHEDEPALVSHSIKDLAHFVGRKISEPTTLIGYSLGGRVALHMALENPLIKKLVLISCSPGMRTQDERTKRQEEDHAWAKEMEHDFESFLFHWYSQAIFTDFRQHESFVRTLERRAKHNPHLLSRVMLEASQGLNPSHWERLSELKIPVLYICGEKDAKYVKIGREMVDLCPALTLDTIPQAGHALHITHAEPVARTVKEWLGH